MKFSQIALQVMAAKEVGVIKSNDKFWKNYPFIENFHKLVEENPKILDKAEFLERSFGNMDSDYGFICAYDDEFPVINSNALDSTKPCLLFYRGDISLLENLNNIVAVIGLTKPDLDIEKRERRFVKELVDNGVVILSGLADGCDSISHRVSVEENSPTIAVLPSTLNRIFPPSNRQLAEDIVSTGGLLLTEYYKEPEGRYGGTARFIERDKLQALFSKAVILTASYRKSDGDCGSRHAMEAAFRFKTNRYMMYNDNKDRVNILFGLNQDYYDDNNSNIAVLSKNSVKEIVELNNPLLNPTFNKPKYKPEPEEENFDQITLG